MTGVHVIGFDVRFVEREALFHFHHGPAVHGCLAARAGRHDLPDGALPLAIESGRVRFAPGDPYRFGLVLRAGGRPGPDEWAAAVGSTPLRSFGRTEGAPLGENFRLDQVVDLLTGAPWPRGRLPSVLSPRTVRPLVDAIAGLEAVTLRLLSPLLVYRTPIDARTHIFDQHVVLPEVLLDRVARSVAAWFPDVVLPSRPPSGLEVMHNGLLRADVVYGPGKRRDGSVGAVTLAFPGGVGPWALPLLLGGFVGIGKGTQQGHGHYEVEEAPALGDWPPRPTRTVLAAGEVRVLDAATAALRGAGRTPGVDGVTVDTFLDRVGLESGRVSAAFRHGNWQPRPLRGLLARRPDGRYRPIAVPTVLDRFAQRAVLEVVRPAVDQLLEDASFAYREGLSRRQAQAGVRRARDEGYTHARAPGALMRFRRGHRHRLRRAQRSADVDDRHGGLVGGAAQRGCAGAATRRMERGVVGAAVGPMGVLEAALRAWERRAVPPTPLGTRSVVRRRAAGRGVVGGPRRDPTGNSRCDGPTSVRACVPGCAPTPRPGGDMVDARNASPAGRR